ncbi:MAG: TetR/AcrR family transcriptional regulator [Desulfuromonadales bacterium]|nr:TetR/AcrR family transcriptional regulator [Desulfuromonadales bacterium]
MTTRERIVETAIELFNTSGTRTVTTNHVAAAMGISPGNLYYHFRNKEEIIRAIFTQMHEVGAREYLAINAERGPGTAETMAETFVMIQRFNWRYRFFKRELTALIMADPLLGEQFVASHRANLAMVDAALERSIAQGFLVPLAEPVRKLLAEQVWMMTLFWLNYLEVGGEEVTDETLERGIDHLQLMLGAYLTDAAKPALQFRGRSA